MTSSELSETQPDDDTVVWIRGEADEQRYEQERYAEWLARREMRMRRERARRRRRAQIRRNRLIALIIGGVLVAGIWNVVGLFNPSGSRVSPRGRVVTTFITHKGPSSVVPGHLTAFSWPSIGEAAVGLQGAGVIATSPKQRIVPIASMTKMMTAILILRDHPLRPGQQGPVLAMTASDAAAWVRDSQSGDSTVPVKAGEHLSEFQLLEGLLMSSGDNIADILAAWDAHSIPAFVAKMNANARALHLVRTTYADPSGVSDGSRSTPAEQVIVAAQLMKDPVARTIVAQQSVSFPVAGTIPNFNPALGTDGIIGVKSGFTQAAMGCLAVAAMRTVHGQQVMEIAVSTGSIYGLSGAATVDEQLLAQATPNLVPVQPIRSTTTLTNYDLPGSTTPLSLRPLHTAPTFIAWHGAHLSSKMLIRSGVIPGSAGVAAKFIVDTPTGTLGTVNLTSAVAHSSRANGSSS